jgi:trans-2,3-dihydro-3-hydroxyanthranilate isomerase
MQAVAREMNYAESTFVLPAESAGHDARVRIFTTMQELPFAGHPAVGTAFVLGRTSGKSHLTLELGVGPIPVTVEAGDGMSGSATMEQPLPTFRPCPVPADDLASLLGVATADISLASPAEFGSAGAEFLYVPLTSMDGVGRARGHMDVMNHLFGASGFHAIYCFCLGGLDPRATAHARVFFPGVGGLFQEDPATGSAAGPFGAYLVRHGMAPAGRMLVEQGYELGRPSQVEVTIDGSGEAITRVLVGGGVVFVAEGELVV